MMEGDKMYLFSKLKSIFKKENKKVEFGKIAHEWIEYKKISIKESTYYNYVFIIDKYLNPEFKDKNIEKIQNYNSYIQKLLDKLSPKTVRDIVNVLKAILKYYEDEYNKILQVKRMSLPKLEKKRLSILSKKEKIWSTDEVGF